MDVVVMYSGGLSSFAAAVRVKIQHGPDAATLLFADTRVEDVDCYRFLRQSAAALDLPLIEVADGRTPWDVADDEGMIPNSRVPLCSRVLKHEPSRRWLTDNAPDALLAVGLGWHEQHRVDGVRRGWEPWKVDFPMTRPPYLDPADLVTLVRSYGIEPPRMYAHGYPHANCAGACLRAGQAAWRHLLLDSPRLYAEQEAREEAFRERTGKDVAVLRERSGPREGMALPLRVLRERVERDGQIDLFDWGGCACTSGESVDEARAYLGGAS